MFDPVHRRSTRKSGTHAQRSTQAAKFHPGLEPLEDRRMLHFDGYQQALVAFEGDDLVGKDGPMSRVGFDLTLMFEQYKIQTSLDPGAAFVPSGGLPVEISGNSINIDLVGSGDANAFRNQLTSLGMTNIVSFGSLVSGSIPLGNLDQLAGLNTLLFARPTYLPITSAGLTTSQADSALHADEARSLFGVDGSGITVGVISDSFDSVPYAGGVDGVTKDIQTGDLPQDTQVLQDFVSPFSTDEGRAMAQLIHDLAPGAAIRFATADVNGQVGFAQNILALANAGANVITDDISYFAEPFFQDGVIAQAAQQVVAQGVSYFSSAGNEEARSYESAFVDSGQTLANGAKLHDFDPGPGVSTLQEIKLPVGDAVQMSFQWDQPFASLGGAGSQSDLDISLIGADGTTVVASSIDQNIGGDPIEFLQALNDGSIDLDNDGQPDTKFYIQISLVSGPAPGLMKYVDFGRSSTIVSFATDSSTDVGHHNTAGVIGVAATAFYGTPQFGITPPVLDYYSSKGGTSILFDTSGQRLTTPFNPNSPQLTGVDGTNTTFFGSDISQDADSFPNFFGTSAAAPHLAAVAALMIELTGGPGSVAPDDIYNALEETAIDIVNRSDGTVLIPIVNGQGFDLYSGYGLVDAVAALQSINSRVSLGDDVAMLEGDSGITNFVFAVNYMGTAVSPVTVAYTTLDGTAVAGADYLSNSGTLTFSVGGATTQWITIGVVADQVVESNETFLVKLSSPENAVLGRSQAVGTILNDDIDLSINDVALVEGHNGLRDAVFTVSTYGVVNQVISVSYTTVNNTAQGASDYLPTAGVVTLNAQTPTALVTVPVVGDIVDEDDETFFVVLTSSHGARIADGTGVGTIIDDDQSPALYVNDVQVTTTASGTFAAMFTVGLDAVSGRAVTANFATSDVSAHSGVDYSGLVGVLTFNPGVRTQTVVVPIMTAAVYSADKTFHLNLTSAQNALMADPQGTATIVFANGPVGERIIDDGDTGYSHSSGWTTVTNTLAYGLDYDYHAAGNDNSTASYTFNGLADGSYEIYAKWIPFSNRATNAPYTILNGSTVVDTVLVNQQAAPSGDVSNGVTWQKLGTYTTTTGKLVVRLGDNANGYVVADAVRLVPNSIAAQTPEIDVAGLGISINTGDTVPAAADGTEFGTTNLNSDSPLHTFTITNNGNALLQLGGSPRVLVSGANASDFLVTVQPAASLNPNTSTNFGILFRPTGTGLRQATVTIANNDSNEGPYTFTIEGTGVAAASPLVHNSVLPQDVNADAKVTSSDVLILVNNLLRGQGAAPLAAVASNGSTPSYYLDVNDDGCFSSSDLLMVVNYMLRTFAAPHAAPAVAEPLAAPAVDEAFVLFDDTAQESTGENAARAESIAAAKADTPRNASAPSATLTSPAVNAALATLDDQEQADDKDFDWDPLSLEV